MEPLSEEWSTKHRETVAKLTREDLEGVVIKLYAASFAKELREDRRKMYIDAYKLAMEKADVASALLALKLMDGGE